MREVWVLGLATLILAGCHQAPVATPSTQSGLAKPAQLPGVGNFARISDLLYRGQQPTAEGFAELKKLGIKTIINLRAMHSDRDLLKGSGLRYVEIECFAWHPEDEDVAAALKVIADPANQPVFVHCQHGADRTGFVVAAYRIVEQGWSAERAEAEMRNFGLHESYFPQVAKYIGQLDPAAMREMIRKAKMPKVEVVE